MKHKKILGIVAVAATLALAGCSTSSTPSGGSTTSSGPIQIGMLSPLTGNLASLGVPAQEAAQLMIDTINSDGGVNGSKLTLTVNDDKSDVTQSVTLFNQLAADKTTSIILSSVSAANSAAVGPSAQTAAIPMLAIGPVDSYANGSNKYAFSVSAPTATVSDVLAKYFASVHVKKLALAFLTQSSAMQPAANATAAAAKKLGIQVVLSEGFDVTATDFTPLITHVKEAGADALMVWGPGAGPAILTKQIAGSGIKLFMSGAQASSLYTKPTGTASNGVVLSSGVAMAYEAMPAGDYKTEVGKFVTAWEAAHSGAFPPQFAFDAATAVQLAAAAIKSAGSSDRSAIRDALEKLNTLTVGGRFTFSATDHSGLNASNIAIVEIQDGKFTATPYTQHQFVSDPPK